MPDPSLDEELSRGLMSNQNDHVKSPAKTHRACQISKAPKSRDKKKTSHKDNTPLRRGTMSDTT